MITMDGQVHDVGRWDLLIAHPPCTYLSKAGGNRLRINGKIQMERYKKGIEAAEFFLKCLNADIPRIKENERSALWRKLHSIKNKSSRMSTGVLCKIWRQLLNRCCKKFTLRIPCSERLPGEEE